MSKNQSIQRARLLGGALLLVALVSAAQAKDEARVTYVGDGRYTCSGNSVACAQVDTNNRQRESQRQADYQREQDRAQSYVDRERHKEDGLRTNR